MPTLLSRAKTVLLDVPRHGKLAYCLLRDERMPTAPKVVLLGALAIIASPIDFPAWIPVLGDGEMLALGVLAVETFIQACPEDIRREHQAALAANSSTFDHDFNDTVSALREGAIRLVRRLRARFQRRSELPYSSSVAEGF